MAERVGFEPTCPCGQLDFESSSLRPLRYRSGSDIPMFALAAYPRGGPAMTASIRSGPAFSGAEPALRFYYAILFQKLQALFAKSFHAPAKAAGRRAKSVETSLPQRLGRSRRSNSQIFHRNSCPTPFTNPEQCTMIAPLALKGTEC